MAFANLVTTGIIILSSLYVGLKVPVIWRRYRGQYGQLLVGLSLVSLLFGLAHVGSIISLPHVVLAVSETGAEIGVLLIIACLGRIHPRLGRSGGNLQ